MTAAEMYEALEAAVPSHAQDARLGVLFTSEGSLPMSFGVVGSGGPFDYVPLVRVDTGVPAWRARESWCVNGSVKAYLDRVSSRGPLLAVFYEADGRVPRYALRWGPGVARLHRPGGMGHFGVRSGVLWLVFPAARADVLVLQPSPWGGE